MCVCVREALSSIARKSKYITPIFIDNDDDGNDNDDHDDAGYFKSLRPSLRFASSWREARIMNP